MNITHEGFNACAVFYSLDTLSEGLACNMSITHEGFNACVVSYFTDKLCWHVLLQHDFHQPILKTQAKNTVLEFYNNLLGLGIELE